MPDHPPAAGTPAAAAAIDSRAIAIVGMACRFPGAADPDAFWRNLRDGRSGIHHFTDAELTAAGVTAKEIADPSYVKANGVLDGIDLFDAGFFGFTPLEAAVTDPQHRVFLEVAWQALEDAGYDAQRFDGKIGVFAGAGPSTYLLHNLLGRRDLEERVGAVQLSIGNNKDYVPTRVSYKLDLKGPSVNVNTACSSSLVAVHLACQSLLSFDADVVLAGGVGIQVPQQVGYHYYDGGIVSPDGCCRPFDARAQGTVNGSGAGVVVLRRLLDAIADRDSIRAVILGSAVNNDGSAKVGFSAPSVSGQAEVIAEALAAADVDPDTIQYVEAHGTATPVGDPIEIAALTQAFALRTSRRGFCAIGSVKSNIGHLDEAAGVAGLIKTVLALEHREIPQTLHFETPNPIIDFAATPFFVAGRRRDWAADGPRRAGVSSFGIGGTNVHCVLEEAPAAADSRAAAGPGEQVLALSARTPSAVDAATRNLAAHLRAHPDVPLAHTAWTLQHGRRAFAHRRTVVATDVADAIARLESAGATTEAGAGTRVVFLFPGQGSQYPAMAKGLYDSEPVFRASFDRCARAVQIHLGIDLRDILYRGGTATRAAGLDQTLVAQPALFAVEYALAELWMSWGITPAGYIGHSLGEYVAATLAGTIAIDAALEAVCVRALLMQGLPPGAMLAVPLGEADARCRLPAGAAIAAINGPSRSVVSGAVEAIVQLRDELHAAGLESTLLQTSHAFHSSAVDGVLDAFTRRMSRFELRPPATPWISNVTGEAITPAEATDPGYWAVHMRRPVRFGDCAETALRDPAAVFLEVGPGSTLTTLMRQQRGWTAGRLTATSLPRRDAAVPERARLLEGLGTLWEAGADVDWRALHDQATPARVPLPTYPFERARYWIEPDGEPGLQAPAAKRSDVDEWFYLPNWTRAPLPRRTISSEPRSTIVTLDAHGLGARIATQLRGRGHTVVEQSAGTDLSRTDATRIVDCAALAGDAVPSGVASAGDFQRIFDLCQATTRTDRPLELIVIADGIEDVTGAETIDPAKAMIAGPLLVVAQERSSIASRLIDVSGWSAGDLDRLAESVAAEIESGSDRFVAWRHGRRWVRSFDRLSIGEPGDALAVRDDGAYLITGGLGGVGLILAEYLATAHRARLALVGRTASRIARALEAGADTPAPAADGRDRPSIVNAWLGDAVALHAGNDNVRGTGAYPGLEAAVADLCCGYILELLSAAGLTVAPGREVSATGVKDALRVTPALQRMCDYFVHALTVEGFLQRDGERLVFADAVAGRPSAQALGAALVQRYPQFEGMFDLLAHCVARYPEALSGGVPAISVLYPDGESMLLERAAAKTVRCSMRDVYARAVRDLLVRMAGSRDGRPLRILEVGVGDGLLAAAVAPALQGLAVDYHATDIGRVFVARAQRAAAAAGLSFMRFGLLDIARDPAPQGYTPGSYDVVLALDVVHATPDVRETCRHLHGLVAPGGIAVVIETVHAPRWTDLIWGLADGWWAFTDPLRAASPLLPAREWVRVLEMDGFEHVAVWPGEQASADTDMALIVGHRPDAAMAPADGASRHAVEVVRRLRDAGAQLLLLDADVADAGAMRAAVAAAGTTFGRIAGVIHAAGDTRRETIVNPIEGTGREQLEAVCRARVHGVQVLADVLADLPLDFIALISSNASVLGGIGLAAYAAASRYLDSFAAARFREGDRRWISTNWDGWPTEAVAGFDSRFRTSIDRYAMTVPESQAAFRRVVSQRVPQIIVSSGDLHQRAAQWIDRRPAPVRQAEAAASYRRPDVATDHAPPVSESERALARIWEELLGIAPVGVDEIFADLGGDSLLGTQLIARIERTFGCRMPFRSLFEEPTVRLQAARIDQLRAAASTVAADPDREETSPAIVRLRDADHFPLSHAQRRLWVLSQLEGSAAYNIPLHQRLDGRLDVAALERALGQLITRHESLRTSIVTIDGEPRQRIAAIGHVGLDIVDLTGRPDSDAEARRLAGEHAARPFDLAAAALFRASLVKIADDRWILLFTIHHIVCDGISIAVLVRDLIELYHAARSGREPTLPALRVQYRDYAAWQERRLQDGTLDAEREYWLQTFADAIAPLDLPADAPRPPVQTFRGRERTWQVPASQAATIAELARAQQVSLFMLLSAVVKVLLYRYTGATEIVIGTPVAGRMQPELADQVGCYLNMLALADRVDPGQSFTLFLERVRRTATSAYDHQDYPFDRLVDQLNLPRDLSRSPLFDVIVILQNQQESVLQLADLEVGNCFEHNGTSKVDLTFTFKETTEGLAIGIEYNSDLFAAARVERMGAHLLNLLRAFVDDPDQVIAKAPLLTLEEQQLAERANQTRRAYRDLTIVETLDERIAASRDAVAVSCGGDHATYGQLSERADAIADLLQRQGIGVGARVGVHLDRSLDLVPALLAILRCGAAYVPLDPAFPMERRRIMIEDAGLAAVLTQAGVDRLPDSTTPILDVDVASIDQDVGPADRPRIAATDLAYVIYTSGSTGRPKGVEIEHRSLVNFLCSMRDEIGVAAGDTLLAVTTLSFDIAGLELWLPLIAGATVVIASRTEAADAVALMARLRQSRPTLMQGTPATWQMLFDAGWDGDRRLTALCGGEGLPYALGRRLAEGTKQAWNLYGPTETTVWSSVCDVTRFFARRQSTAPFESDAVVPIGYPIANTTLHILDGAHQVVPSGVPGELYIGGTGVARGYHGRPDATAERFLPDPFDTRESARLYRTGDRASRRDDGAIEHLGRLDDQVKLRGFRIETAEIEAALLRHPAVAQAAVVLQPPPFGPRLLAAVVPRIHGEGADADAQLVADLRAALRTALPEYMVPAAFAVLPELPRTPNGKTDRRALRDAGAIGARERTGRLPSTPTERLLCEVWAELLRVDAVTVDSNFFDLGGHSLRAARLSFRLAQERGVRLTLADIFQHPTVEALARLVDERGAAEPEAGVAAPAIPTAPMTAEELEMLNE